MREICRRLDGLPLAIELAAAQLAHLPPRELLDRLDRRFELLAAGRGRRHQRQSSLHAVLGSTWALLGEDERELLGRLAVFPATFDLDSVEGVCRSPSVPSPLSSLRGLVTRSLVAVANDVGRPAYRVLETVKLYALNQYGEDQVAAFRQRHAQWFAGRVLSTPAEQQLTSTTFAGWYGRVYEDLRAASRLALHESDVEQAAAIVAAGGIYWHITATSRSLDGLHRIDELLSRNPSPAARAQLHLAAALAGMGARSPQRMAEDSTIAAAEAAASDQPGVAAMALCVSSWMRALRDPDAGIGVLEQAEEVASAAGMRRLRASVTSYKGLFLSLAGRPEEAEKLTYPMSLGYEGARDYAVRNALSGLWAATVLRDPHLATRAALEGIAANQQADLPRSWAVELLAAGADAASGRFQQASARLEGAAALARREGADDGLPDLLIVPAVAAYRCGDARRGATFLRAIREAGRPTQNFLVTIVYRQLRCQWTDVEPEPTEETLAVAFDEARRWLADIS